MVVQPDLIVATTLTIATDRHKEAILLYKKTLELKPDFGEAIANLFHCQVRTADVYVFFCHFVFYR